MRTQRVLAMIVVFCTTIGSVALGQDAAPAKENKNGAKSAANQKNGFRPPDLVAGLKATPGCIGVETARTSSGKNVIFAWFENKRAVLKWFYSDMHQDVMKSAFPDIENKKALKDVPAEAGPILVIASISMAKESKFKATNIPISQIAIELYQPLPGGASLGGRFAPAAVKVPNMRDYTDYEPAKEK